MSTYVCIIHLAHANMNILRADYLVLDTQLYPSLERASSPTPSFPRVPPVLCVGFRPCGPFSIQFSYLAFYRGAGDVPLHLNYRRLLTEPALGSSTSLEVSGTYFETFELKAGYKADSCFFWKNCKENKALNLKHTSFASIYRRQRSLDSLGVNTSISVCQNGDGRWTCEHGCSVEDFIKSR